jgi:hypothetical protein
LADIAVAIFRVWGGLGSLYKHLEVSGMWEVKA